jgi:hypothetical protein
LHTGASLDAMSIMQLFARSAVGDVLGEYDEFDLDAGLEAAIRRDDWIEPSW